MTQPGTNGLQWIVIGTKEVFFSQRRRKGEKSRKSWGRKRKQKAGEKEPGEKGK
jgi:hypothetical protein